MMAERQVIILNTLGLHVRPSASFAEIAGRYRSEVSVIKDGQAVNAKSSIDLLTLAAIAGTRLLLRAEGNDAQDAVDALAQLVDSRFGEE